MEILKKPYEISLWDDQLIWHRRKLVNANISSASAYEPGKYYSKNQTLGGSGTDGANNSAIPYTLDYGDYVQDRVYYSLAPWTNGNYKEGESAEDVSIPSSEQANWTNSVVLQYYKEIKICTIGSNTMQGEARAVNPKLVTNVNGSNTLTFTMYYTYWDEITNQLEWNPFMMYLANERKVKLHYDGKWYDFVIKNISEDSNSKAFTYTCKDLFINELSKSGFEIELDVELANNMGTLTELAETVLEESDWQLKDGENLIVRQYLEEPIYEITLKKSEYLPDGLKITKMYSDDTQIAFPYGKKIYMFYSSINGELSTVQFLYDPDQKYVIDDSNIIIGYSEDNTNGIYNYSLEGVTWEEGQYSNQVKIPHITSGGTKYSLGTPTFCAEKRGKKLVKSALTEYDPKTKKTVQVYKALRNDASVNAGTTVYGYIESEYLAPTAVTNLIANPSSFSSNSGWLRRNVHGSSQTKLPDLDLEQYPRLEDISDFANYTATSCLKFTPTEVKSALMNTGINNNRTSIGEFVVDNEYILRANITTDLAGAGAASNYDVIVCEYTEDSGKYILWGKDHEEVKYTYDANGAITGFASDSDLPLFTRYYDNSAVTSNQLAELYLDPDDSTKRKYTWCDTYKCNYTLTNEELKNKKIGVFIIATGTAPLYIRELQFFKYQLANKKDSDTIIENVVCYPGATLEAIVKTYYSYYKDFNTYEPDNISHIYRDTAPNSNYAVQYGEGSRAYEKVRSITAKESNRFNLIQELCELFECWAKFTIEHNNSTGEILLDSNCRQKKWVSFHEYIGTDNPVGFRYGLNLKSIKRTLDSNGAITKIIVKNNANEQAKNGFCSIARAQENPSGENSIYNFDYYVNQKLVSYESINQDLNAPIANGQGYLAHYANLKVLNTQAQVVTEKLAGILAEIAEWDSSYQTYKASYDAANSDWADQKIKFQDLTGIPPEKMFPEYSYWDRTQNDVQNDQLIWKYYDKNDDGTYTENSSTGMWCRCVWWDEDEAKKILAALSRAQTIIKDHKIIYENAETMKNQKEEEKEGYQDELDVIRNKKLKINKTFYKKYSRFMQEGSWISEDYIDDNLYYIDALSTLYTSSRPKVTYTIETIELSALPEFENFVFSVGDKTFVEDEEFFGWAYDGSDRLYREEVIVSEITTELEAPEKNKIKVQNYKTQFEDLFQRIAATTAQVEFSTGEYKRGAQIVEPDGTISVETLQNSFKNNSITLQNSNSQSVIIGENGITITDLFKPNEQIRLISGGIFLTRDGGSNWTAGITASGINASCLTTGTINATEINITMGGVATLRWDALGISAYRNSNAGVVPNTFVRFDQFGLYGIDKISNFNPIELARKEGAEDEIERALEIVKEKANFGLTWKEFWLRSRGTKGYVSISSDKDFEVIRTNEDQETPIIQIGRLDGNEDYYGIRISDLQGSPVLETNQNGELWLKKKLSVQTSGENSVQIGYLANHNSENVHEVLNANDKFKIYENGRIEGTEAHFTGGSTFEGTITATGGKIGNLEIVQIEDSSYRVVIETSNGTVLKKDESVTKLTATLFLGSTPITENVQYQWYKNGSLMYGYTAREIEVSGVDVSSQNETAVYQCEIQLNLT